MTILASLPQPDENRPIELFFSIDNAVVVAKAITRHRLIKLTGGRSAKITRFTRGATHSVKVR